MLIDLARLIINKSKIKSLKVVSSTKRALVKLGKKNLFHFKSSFRFQENQILEFQILKFRDIIKCLSIKQEIHFTE